MQEIEQLGNKVTILNLSHNLLTQLPANLPLLTNICKLDLSKNMLTELPENFGQLRNLKSLDLYANKIEKLPVSFAQLKSLKWLDLKVMICILLCVYNNVVFRTTHCVQQ